MKYFLLSTTLLLMIACNKANDTAGSTGSGAGIEREEEYDDQDANITTPIESRPDEE